MKASIVDLRYKTREILEALERNESVTVLYHGRVRGGIQPAGMRSADALIAATAVERNLVLVSSNTKHFKAVAELRLKAFRP
jgi:predicted nucleic acid-binding protein